MDAGAERPEERTQGSAENVIEHGTTGTGGSGMADFGGAGGTQDMGSLLEQYEERQHTQLRRGELVDGTVVLVDRDEVLVDIGGKMEAILPTGEVQNRTEPLKRGDLVSAVVIVPENAEGRPVISINRAQAEIGWRDLQTKFNEGQVVDGEVVDQNKGGLIVAVDGVRGFVPLSQIVELRRGGSEEEVEEKLRAMRGQRLFLKVIEMNRRRNRLILSERAASQERRAAQKDRLLAELQPGEVRHGRVSSLTDFGAFVDLGGADGLIHLSELSWGQVQHPSQVLRVGQDLDVRVVGVDRETKKIALSLKQVEENPWTRIETKYHVGDMVTAKITKLAQFGAFAEVEPGVEGLVHISELSDERITHPKQVVREGEELPLKIIKIDSQRHRLGLSLRQAEEGGGFGGMEDWGGGSYGGGYGGGGGDGAPDNVAGADEIAEGDDGTEAEAAEEARAPSAEPVPAVKPEDQAAAPADEAAAGEATDSAEAAVGAADDTSASESRLGGGAA